MTDSPSDPILKRERPEGVDPAGAAVWASDEIAALLRDLDLGYVALNPGSSYRGLHDSLVNYLGNEAPQMLLSLHEEHAVAIAHGFAKVTDRPMAVAIHSNVGLMHASMAIFNAYADRVPILLLGASGPLDADRRRPWIDWLHTATDQAALVRPFVKWDDQPLSPAAAIDAVLQAHMVTSSVPRAPTYVCFDASVLETKLEQPTAVPPTARFAPAAPAQPTEETVAALAARLLAATSPVILAGRVSRSESAWQERIELVEAVGATVFTHLKLPGAFPTGHPQHGGAPSTFSPPALRAALAEADLILSLDWLDLGGTLGTAGTIAAETISVSLDQQLHSGWGKESFAPAPVDLRIAADVDATVTALLRHLPATGGDGVRGAATPSRPRLEPGPTENELTARDIAVALGTAIGERPTTLVRVPNSWSGEYWAIEHPLDMLGADGGEGIGSGPGMAIGAALALRDSERLVVAVLGDGDYLMGVNALWTAAHYELPVLIVVANNRSFFNDEIHQHRVAVIRDRPVANRWIGQRVDEPEADLAGLARAQGLLAHGPVTTREELASTLQQAVAETLAGRAVVVDVRISSSLEAETARAVTQHERG
jgi:thiamine pyrophosphate-dependent acetolactate synthase large subunit-like protein